MFNNHRWWIILLWATALIVYTVSDIDRAIQLGGIASSVITSPVGVQLSGSVSAGGPLAVSVGSNSVWVVDPAQNSVIILSRNKDGSIRADYEPYK